MFKIENLNERKEKRAIHSHFNSVVRLRVEEKISFCNWWKIRKKRRKTPSIDYNFIPIKNLNPNRHYRHKLTPLTYNNSTKQANLFQCKLMKSNQFKIVQMLLQLPQKRRFWTKWMNKKNTRRKTESTINNENGLIINNSFTFTIVLLVKAVNDWKVSWNFEKKSSKYVRDNLSVFQIVVMLLSTKCSTVAWCWWWCGAARFIWFGWRCNLIY